MWSSCGFFINDDDVRRLKIVELLEKKFFKIEVEFSLPTWSTHPLAPTLLSNPFSCWWWWFKFVECNCCCCCWKFELWWWWCWPTLLDDVISEWFKFWFNWFWLWFDCWWWKLREFRACWFNDAVDEFDDTARFCDWSDESGWWDNEIPVNDSDGIRSIIFRLRFSGFAVKNFKHADAVWRSWKKNHK